MSGSVLLWLLLALLVFWGVGLYNRLMRLRARGVEVLGVVEKHMRACIQLLSASLASVEALRELPLEGQDHHAAEWNALMDAMRQVDILLKGQKSNPLEPVSLLQIASAWMHMLQMWDGVCNGPLDLAGSAIPEDLRLEWSIRCAKVSSARGGLNQILVRYNEALHQFPARFLAGTMGFEQAGQL